MNVKPATAKISSLALKHNLQVIKEKAPHSKIIAVVKANAYGHDVVFVLIRFRKHGGLFCRSTFGRGVIVTLQRYY